MLIEGPLRIRSEAAEDGGGFTLRLSFTEAFQALERPARAADLADYLRRLRAQARAAAETDPNRQGMLLVLQVGEQLLPLVRAGELPLSEELEIQVDQQPSLAGFLAAGSDRVN